MSKLTNAAKACGFVDLLSGEQSKNKNMGKLIWEKTVEWTETFIVLLCSLFSFHILDSSVATIKLHVLFMECKWEN